MLHNPPGTNMSPHTGALHQQQPTPQQSNPTQANPNGGQQQQQNVTSISQQPVLSTQPQHSQHSPLQPQQMYGPTPTQGYVPHGGGVYQMVSSSGVPSNVFVSNVTANVNLHGYMPHNAPMQHYMSANAPPFVPAELQHQQQQVGVSSAASLSDQVENYFLTTYLSKDN